jgi:four helix bundle protein
VRVRAITEYPAAAKDFDFCDDIRRSARSSPSNIAEGYRRRRPRQFAQFLNVALASIDETENHLGEALEARYIEPTEYKDLLVLVMRTRIASQRYSRTSRDARTHAIGHDRLRRRRLMASESEGREAANPRTREPRNS